MIIFDLDGTLADCSHRLHFIEEWKPVDGTDIPWGEYRVKDEENPSQVFKSTLTPNGWTGTEFIKGPLIFRGVDMEITHYSPMTWKPNWDKFYQECYKDEPIKPVVDVFYNLIVSHDIEIWSGRSEIVRDMTLKWLHENVPRSSHIKHLRMRPIGEYMPDDDLKESWLDEHIANGGNSIEMVFEDRPRMVRMWRKRGIFVCNVCQHDQEF